MSQRLPCSKCGTPILTETAKATGGVCRPCSGVLSPRTTERRAAFMDAYQRIVPEVAQRRAAEAQVREVADWFGLTGLDETIERELPRYLRRELGEFLDEPDGLKAGDLTYLGLLSGKGGKAHYWRVPGRNGEEDFFAYVALTRTGQPTMMGWGDRVPPKPRGA